MSFKNKNFLSLLLLAAFCMVSTQYAIAQASVRAYADARKITIGDQVKVWLEVKPSSRNDRVLWPQMQDSLAGLEIVEKGRIDTVSNKDTFLLRQRLLVTGFDSGQYYIPSFAFHITTNGQEAVLNTDSLPLQVTTVAVDTTKDFKPIKDIVAISWSIWDYWQIILAALLLIGFGVFIWIYFYKNRKNKIPVKTKVPPEKSHEKALRLLEELKAKQLAEQGRGKEYFSELSDIIRVYLEERFGITAMEQTTDELLALLKKQNEAKAELRKLRPELKLILRTADMAKFAKANPLPHEYSACMAAAVEVVRHTQIKTEEGAS